MPRNRFEDGDADTRFAIARLRGWRNGDAGQALLGVTAVAAAGGLAYLIGRELTKGPRDQFGDAPISAQRNIGAPIGRTVTINKSRGEVYAFFRDFANLPRVMENIERIDVIDARLSHWVVKAPAGATVEWDAIVTEDEPDRLIAWESAKGAIIANSGRVEFLDAAPGRGTMLRATIRYVAPGGTLGRGIAKLLQREPNIQARRDLRRLKQFLETGEVTSSASPSGRKNESPTEQYL